MMRSTGSLLTLLALTLSAPITHSQLQHRPAEVTPQAPLAPPLTPPPHLDTPRSPNSNTIYQSLRSLSPSGPSFAVKELKLQRDVALFTFHDGAFYLYGDVNGHVTGAVFLGNATLHIEPPSLRERNQLKLVLKTTVVDTPFTSAVFAFTDDTAAELRKAAAGPAPSSTVTAGPADEMHKLFRHDLHYNLEERLLQDVVKPGPGGFFLANMKGPLFSKRIIYIVDPNGAFGVAPEEVGLLSSADGDFDVTLGFPSASRRSSDGSASSASPLTFRIPQQAIDITIERNGSSSSTAVTRVVATKAGVQALPLQLFPTLRVSGVYGPQGEALDFIQEDKEHDPDFAVLLPHPLALGESIIITTRYAGKDALLDEGNGNYYPVGGARESWYPNVRGKFDNYADYHFTFRVPKGLQVVATGSRVREASEGNKDITEWQTRSPIVVAGFSLGKFRQDISERNPGVMVMTYANTDPPNNVKDLLNSGPDTLGTMNTTSMLKRATSEADAAISIYTNYFGPLPYDHVAITQQSACNYGQSWPMLVYLPICYFYDSTVQHQLGLLDSDPTYWKVVTPHEVAHQWWGQTVGFSSYRDQWMSEGFADFSASLFLLMTNPKMDQYHDFWAQEKRRLIQKNQFGMRPIDVGPVTMGNRLNTSRSGGSVYQSLIYPKGAYILHMLEMMYWTPQEKAEPFKKAMRDFVETYRNRAATTEDFKQAMEKYLPPALDLDGNHKLDWFFNEYVYGTDLPHYEITSTFQKQGDATSVHVVVSQSKVPDSFVMLVPVYLESQEGKVLQLGKVRIHGTSSVDTTINLGKLPFTPKRLLLNYNYDVLSD
jgi:Peptidase family M1 domain